MNNTRPGHESNIMVLTGTEITVVPYVKLGTDTPVGVTVKINRYNLEDCLGQLLDEYGEERIIALIESSR